MIEIVGLGKRYGATEVLRDVTLHIPRGGVVAIVGPNGAGKSTLLSVLGRLLRADEGSVTVDGLDVSTTKSTVLARRVALLRQDNHVPVRLTVRELVAFGRFPHHRGRPTAQDDEHAERAIARLALEPLAHRRLDQLSGGQRQRAFIATVLCQDTDYVLLDEPLNSLDLRHAMETMRLVRALADDLGKTVVTVLHDINVAASHADRIIAMRDGRIAADGPPATIIERLTLRTVFDVDVDVREVDGVPVAMHFAPSTPKEADARRT